MASTSETGHAKNVANFQDLITLVTAFGTAYNPAKAALKIPQLQALAMASNAKIADVVAKKTLYNNTVNDRMALFATLQPLSTRLINALKVTDATAAKIDDAKAFNRKIQGKRASAIATSADPASPPPSAISVSQLSYDQLIQHFAGFLSLLQSEPTYAPNETDLKTATLVAKQADMVLKNNTVTIAYAQVSTSRIQRNKTLYDPNTGLVATAAEVKNYVKSLFGPHSPEYAQISGIFFKSYWV